MQSILISGLTFCLIRNSFYHELRPHFFGSLLTQRDIQSKRCTKFTMSTFMVL